METRERTGDSSIQREAVPFLDCSFGRGFLMYFSLNGPLVCPALCSASLAFQFQPGFWSILKLA